MFDMLATPPFRPLSRLVSLVPVLVIGSHLVAVPALAQNHLLPTNPSIAAGDISISQPSATAMQVDQTSASGIINWEGFSVGQGHSVAFDNGSGATLNRVTGNELSQIYGNLSATGSLYLVNQNGVVFGETGVVRTGNDFVVSTLNVADSDFLDGGDTTFTGGSDGFVLNFGEVASLGGDVALISRTVRNFGTLEAESGTVGVIAGREVLMRDADLDQGRFLVRVGGADTEVEEAGIIRAAAAELRVNGGNIYALAGNTKGTVHATSVAKSGGRIFLTAGKSGAIKLEKTLRASRGDRGGKVDVTGGSIEASGLIDASGLVTGGEVLLFGEHETRFSGEILSFGDRAEGNGGFVEVSARHQLSFNGRVDSGGGTLLIDPDNVEVTSSSPNLIGASTVDPFALVSSLDDNEVIIHTTGSDTEAGTILISEQLVYSSSNSLSFLAHGDILIEADVQNLQASGGGDVNFVAGWDGSTSTTTFDVAAFDALDLETQTVFGNSSGLTYEFFSEASFDADGSIFIGSCCSDGISVGSRSGETNVYTNDLDLFGGADNDFFAQLGVSGGAIPDGESITGGIFVRATDDVFVTAGGDELTFAQIGHGSGEQFGEGGPLDFDASGEIAIEALGDIVLEGDGPGSYAMIGHGSSHEIDSFYQQSLGLRSGDITIDAGGDIELLDGPIDSGVTDNLAVIGHRTGTADAVSNADILLQAFLFADNNTGIGDDVPSTFSSTLINRGLEGGGFILNATDTSFELDAPISSSAGNDLILHAGDNLTLNSGATVTSTGAGNIVLSANNLVVNATGNDAPISVGTGRWVVYATRPESSGFDLDLAGQDFIDYDTTFDPGFTFDVFPPSLSAGNGFAFSIAPEITFEASDQTITYGETIDTADFSAIVEVGGVVASAAALGIDLDAYTTNVATSSAVTFSTSGFANAGTYATGLETSTTADSSALSGVTFSDSTAQLVVNQRSLAISPAASFDKTYDGTTVASLTLSDDRIAGDLLNIAGSASFLDKNVGTEKTVNVTLSPITGADVGNYILPSLTFSDTGDITPRDLTVMAEDNFDKVYDGTTDVASLTLSDDRVVGDDLIVAGTAQFEDKNAGIDKDVIITLSPLGGADANNYTLALSELFETGDITPRDLIVTPGGSFDKIYDGTTDAILTLEDNRIAGDILTFTGTADFEDKNAGEDKVVNIALSGLGGTDAGNYTLSTLDLMASGDIAQRSLSVFPNASFDKTYDGNTDAPFDFGDDRILGDDLTITGTASFEDKNAGNNKVVTVSLSPITGADAGNYIQPVVDGDFEGTITPLEVELTATPQDKIFDGSTEVEIDFSGDVLTGDDVTFAGTGTLDDPEPGFGKTVEITSLQVMGVDAFNYAFADPTGTNATATVLPANPPEAPRPQPQIDIAAPTPVSQPSPEFSAFMIMSDFATDTLVSDLNAASDFCRQIGEAEYLIDCLGDRLAEIARRLPNTGAYADSKEALEEAARKLDALVRENASAALPPLQVATRSLSNGRRASGTIRAVSTDALASLNARAAAIIQEAETVLLRSAESSSRRRVHYARIAQAVGSNKVLLRSS